MGLAILEAYNDLFSINENPTSSDRVAIEGKFKTVHGSKDAVARIQANTFLTLLGLADIEKARQNGGNGLEVQPKQILPDTDSPKVEDKVPLPANSFNAGLHYNIQIHLPATKDIEVYNAIFKSIKQNLYDG